MEHTKWTSIESLRHVRKTAKFYGQARCTYKAKVKLHGTNGGVRINGDGTIIAQSRTNDLTEGSDNMGFSAWVQVRTKWFAKLPPGVVMFGEFCGPGIQKGCAVNSIPDKVFAVFSVQHGTMMYNEPDMIQNMLDDVGLGPEQGVYVLPWVRHDALPLVINFERAEDTRPALERLVADIEACDPWVKDTFGIEGVGEGLVLYPMIDGTSGNGHYCSFSKWVFKAKGKEHKVKSTKQRVEIAPETLATIDEFVAAYVTDGRLDQCLGELGVTDCDRRCTGEVIKWMSKDIHKESADDLPDGITWKQLAGAVSARVRQLYFARE